LVEATLITGLTASGGDREQVTAAMLVYRALTWFLPILVGVVCYLWWRSRLASQPATAGSPQVGHPGGRRSDQHRPAGRLGTRPLRGMSQPSPPMTAYRRGL
jgi:hypothetical protein